MCNMCLIMCNMCLIMCNMCVISIHSVLQDLKRKFNSAQCMLHSIVEVLKLLEMQIA